MHCIFSAGQIWAANDAPETLYVGNELTGTDGYYTQNSGGGGVKYSGGDGTSDNPYIVASADDLRSVADGNGLYFVQIGDIDLGGEAWTPLELNGTYDGGGYKITGLTIAETGHINVALFSSIGTNGVVKNLTVEANITSTSMTGIIAADNYGSVINCATSGAIEATCSGSGYFGGVVGNNNGTGKVLLCSSSAKITVETTASDTYVGGIVGVNSQDGDGAGIVELCSSSAEITVTGGLNIYVGGAVGNNMSVVMNCSNSGDIKAGDENNEGVIAGGIVGMSQSGSTVTNCSNTGDITAKASYSEAIYNCYAGGVIGSNGGTLKYSTNSGAVKMTGTGSHYVGGVVGCNYETAAFCFNSGAIESPGGGDLAEASIGGVAGRNRSGALSNCINTGEATVTGGEPVYIGGVAGDNQATITNCGWLEAEGMPDKGVGKGSGDGTYLFTSNEILTLPAVITAEIDRSRIEKGETAEITFSLKNPKGDELDFSDYAEIIEPAVSGAAKAEISGNNTITVTGQSTGTAEITAKVNITQWYDFGTGQNTVLDTPIEYSCPFIVTVVPPVPVESVTLETSELSLTTAQTWELTATVSPEEASGETLKWVSSDPSVATVDANGTSCTILPVSMGATTITVSAGGDVSASCKVTVTEKFVTDVTLSHDITEETLYIGEEYTITAEVAPDDATSKEVEWIVDDPDGAISVVTKNENTLTFRAVAEGSFSVTAISKGNTDVEGNKAKSMVQFDVRYNPLTEDQIKAEGEINITISTDETCKLTAYITGDTELGTDSKWTWTSDNENIATVKKEENIGNASNYSSSATTDPTTSTAIVTPVAAGTAKITATYTDSKYKGTVTYTVTVREPIYYSLEFDEHPCEGVTLNSDQTTVKEGGTLYLYVEKEDETLYNYDEMRIYAKRGANADWEELTEDPNRPGVYPITDIWSDIFIKVEGVTPIETPLTVAGVETLRIYAADGLLYVQTPTRQRVTIISMAGTIIADGEQDGVRIYRDLNAGVYIVRVEEQVRKAVVK